MDKYVRPWRSQTFVHSTHYQEMDMILISANDEHLISIYDTHQQISVTARQKRAAARTRDKVWHFVTSTVWQLTNIFTRTAKKESHY